jgi:hypothetical protein
MANHMKDKAADMGEKVSQAAKNVGDRISHLAENAVEFAKEKTGLGETEDRGVAGIQEHMDVVASCGKTIGKVDHLEGNAIKLTKKDSPDGVHHFIPTSWIERVDSHVHLTKNSMEAEAGWKTDSASCGCG